MEKVLDYKLKSTIKWFRILDGRKQIWSHGHSELGMFCTIENYKFKVITHKTGSYLHKLGWPRHAEYLHVHQCWFPTGPQIHNMLSESWNNCHLSVRKLISMNRSIKTECHGSRFAFRACPEKVFPFPCTSGRHFYLLTEESQLWWIPPFLSLLF